MVLEQFTDGDVNNAGKKDKGSISKFYGQNAKQFQINKEQTTRQTTLKPIWIDRDVVCKTWGKGAKIEILEVHLFNTKHLLMYLKAFYFQQYNSSLDNTFSKLSCSSPFWRCYTKQEGSNSISVNIVKRRYVTTVSEWYVTSGTSFFTCSGHAHNFVLRTSHPDPLMLLQLLALLTEFSDM